MWTHHRASIRRGTLSIIHWMGIMWTLSVIHLMGANECGMRME
jgi:hypothetical protein